MTEHTPPKQEDFKAAASDALEDFKKEEMDRLQDLEMREAEKQKRNKVWVACRWAVLIVSIGIIIAQMPKVISALNKDERPLRIGNFDTDALTDQCIQNLWQISRGLQEGKLPDGSMVCPASNKPYQIVRTEDDIIVRSPHPELYGHKEIWVSKRKPVPEIVE